MYHSGTVGAALTARNGGISGVAVSQAVAGFGVEGQGWDEMIADQRWDTAATVAGEVVGGRAGGAAGRAGRRQRQRPQPAARRDRRVAPRRRSACCRRAPWPPATSTRSPGRDGVFAVRMEWGDEVELPPETDGGAIERDEVTVTYLSRLVAEPRDRPGRRRHVAGPAARRAGSYTPAP